jgi:adenosine kinase
MNNDTLAHNIRGWVHYDNLTTGLQKQVLNARRQRDTFEEQVRTHLIQNKIPSAVIQVSGGKLQLQEEKATSSLTMKSLTESAQSFFPGAMSEARNIELSPIMQKVGRLDMMVISPDDPEAMLRHSEVCRQQAIPFAADPSQQMARMSGEEIKLLIDGASYLFLNEYELALAMQKTGWTDREILERVKYRVVTLGSDGAKVESAAGEFVQVGCPKEKSKTDPTGVGDSFRSGFIAGLSWGVSHERCAQLGALIATYVIETLGTQEYRFTNPEFIARFAEAYGQAAADEIAPHL